ncbi:MAG: hypothetical protein P0111_15435 [Nitrospira sp.]|nr:hypothetical protein [Nitrospira sp.]
MTSLLTPLAGAMTVLYLVLTIGAAACLSGPTAEPTASSTTTSQHHSPSHVSHSALCAWACQANPAVAGLFIAPAKLWFTFLLLLPLLTLTLHARFSSPGSLSRAPPR